MAEPLSLGDMMTEDTPAELAPRAYSESDVVRCIQSYVHEAEQGRQARLDQNRINWDAYHNRQDFSHKLRGQSKEFLPKVGMATEQFAAFIKRALTDYGSWFSVDAPPQSPLEAEAIQDLLLHFLQATPQHQEGKLPFSTVMASGVKAGALSSLVILKVYGETRDMVQWRAEPAQAWGGEPQLVQTVQPRWQLRVDVIPDYEYLPDPSGANLYQIHRVERDYYEVLEAAEQGLYDLQAVQQLGAQLREEDATRKARMQGQSRATAPSLRKKVTLVECWGTLLNQDGEILERDCLTTIADSVVLRMPEPNPLWHGQSPFVVAPLIRVPFSVWHKALMDNATSLNVALNELMNLMLDGGMAAVWGIRQIRASWLEDPRQVSGGIPAGTTLKIKDEVPLGAKVLESVAGGQVPAEALAMYNLADREFQAASLVNDLKLGLLPPKQVKATEISEQAQQSSVMFDGIVRDLEDSLIEPLLWKAWLTILQYADHLESREVLQALGPRATLLLAQLSPAERYAQFAAGYTFQARGLSATVARVRDFQKLVGLMGVIEQNPLLQSTFAQQFAPDKVIEHFFRLLNIDPLPLERTAAEQQQGAPGLPSIPGMGGAPGVSPSPSGAPSPMQVAQPPQGGPGLMAPLGG